MKVCRKCINKARGYEVFKESEQVVVSTKCPVKKWQYINCRDIIPNECAYKLEHLLLEETEK